VQFNRLDDEMYEDFQTSFPEFSEATDPKSVLKIDEEAMKSAEGKEKWRVFINKYENKGKFPTRSRRNSACMLDEKLTTAIFLSHSTAPCI